MNYITLFFSFFLILNLFGQEQKIQENQRYTSGELLKAASSDIKLSVTRGDLLSMFVQEIDVVSKGNNKYLVDIEVNCFGENESVAPLKTYSYAFDKTTPTPSGQNILNQSFSPIFNNIDTSEYHFIKVIIRLTKLDDPDVARLQTVVNKYVGQAFEGISIGGVLTDILGFDGNTKKEKIEFELESTYTIPLNFQEYFEHLETIPVIRNQEDDVLAFDGQIPIDDPSFFGKLKRFAKAGDKLIRGKSNIRSDKFDKISAYCKVYFTKDLNTNVPPYIERALEKLIDATNGGDDGEIVDNVKECRIKLDEFKKDFPSAKRAHNNVKFLIDLATVMQAMYTVELSGADKQKQAVTKFKAWLRKAETQAPTDNFTMINYSGVYSSDLIKEGRKNRVAKFYDGKIYIPYSLGNEFLLQIISFQQTLHEFTSDYLDEHSNERANKLKFFTNEFFPKEAIYE